MRRICATVKDLFQANAVIRVGLVGTYPQLACARILSKTKKIAMTLFSGVNNKQTL